MHELENDPPEMISAEPVDGDMFHWMATLRGPPDTPFEGGKFSIAIELSDDYPYEPPRCRFATKIFHPNISYSGDIRLNILKNDWSPSLSISKVLISILSLLDDPNSFEYINEDAARLYREDREQYNLTARNFTQQYAI